VARVRGVGRPRSENWAVSRNYPLRAGGPRLVPGPTSGNTTPPGFSTNQLYVEDQAPLARTCEGTTDVPSPSTQGLNRVRGVPLTAKERAAASRSKPGVGGCWRIGGLNSVIVPIGRTGCDDVDHLVVRVPLIAPRGASVVAVPGRSSVSGCFEEWILTSPGTGR